MSAEVEEVIAHKLRVVVYGLAIPQGSKRHVGHGILVESNEKGVRTWREDVKLAALRAMRATPSWDRDYAAVVAHMAFTLPRPRSHYRTGRFAELLRDDAPTLHSSRPDLDKLLRSTWDALTAAGAYADDCRIAQVWATKSYPSPSEHGDRLDRPGAVLVLSGVKP